jgi:hypothetical protein
LFNGSGIVARPHTLQNQTTVNLKVYEKKSLKIQTNTAKKKYLLAKEK